jgi:hypothetical protein
LISVVNELSDTCVETEVPHSFEELGQGYGFILYMTKLKDLDINGKILSIPNLHDRAYVQVGSRSVGVLYRNGVTSLVIDLPDNKNDTLYVFVENMGRINYGDEALDNKGILNGVILDGKVLHKWRTCLTRNFIPNYQANLVSGKNSSAVLNKPFVDLVAKYKTPANLLTSDKIKYGHFYWLFF